MPVHSVPRIFACLHVLAVCVRVYEVSTRSEYAHVQWTCT